MSRTPTIIYRDGSVWIEVTDDIYIVIPMNTSPPRRSHAKPKVLTIRDTDEEDPRDLNFWTSDIDALIEALQDTKAALVNLYD